LQNLLITGGCGFIGANFIHYLFEEAGYNGQVVNVDSLTYAGNPESLGQIPESFKNRYHFIQADIGNTAKMASIFADFEIDAVCHFAAESHVDRSIVAPDAFVSTNVLGTFTLLEQARHHQNRLIRFHHISTDEVYGTLGKEGRFLETTPYDPSSPYSASKAASDHLVRAYHRTYGLPVTLSNCSNNYGPYQFPEKLIPLIILNAHNGKALPVYGDGRNVRDWLHVTDHCRAIWRIMNNGKNGATYNIGGRCEKTNLSVVETICDVLDRQVEPLPNGSRKELITFVKDRPGHDFRYAIDCTKIENELGWLPRETFESGLEKTVAWYLENGRWVERIQSGAYRNWIEQHYGD